MPKIRTSRTKAPPEGFEEIESILEDYARAMRDAENENTEGKRAKGAFVDVLKKTRRLVEEGSEEVADDR